jgi:tetratricopeptide (TPR) repeat protein
MAETQSTSTRRTKRTKGELHPHETKWRELGGAYAAQKLCEKMGIKQADLARAIDADPREVSAVLTGKQPLTSDWLEKLVQAAAMAAHLSESDRRDLAADLALHSGLLPIDLLSIGEVERENAIALMRALATLLTENLSGGAGSRETDTDERFAELLKQLEQSIDAWKKILNFAKMRRGANWPDIESHWQEIDEVWHAMSDQQRAFAVIERADTLALRGLTADALVMLREALARFPLDIESQDKPRLRFLYRRMYQKLGDVYREAGEREKASRVYGAARLYCENDLQRFDLFRREFNAYLRIGASPPAQHVDLLRGMLDHGRFEGPIRDSRVELRHELSPEHKAKVCHSLAWYYRNQGPRHKDLDREYSLQAIDWAEMTRNPRDIAISKHYAAEMHLRQGEFKEAARFALEAHQVLLDHPTDVVRRGWALITAARGQAYCAFLNAEDSYSLGDALKSLLEADRALSNLGLSRRRQQTLMDLGKFTACLAAAHGPGGFAQQVLNFDHADEYLDQARATLSTLGKYRRHDEYAINVNVVIVDYLRWLSQPETTSRHSDTTEGQRLLDLIEESLRQVSPVRTQEVATRYEMNYGHQARLKSLLTGVKLIRGLVEHHYTKGKRDDLVRTTRRAVEELAELADKHDPMAVVDCRWYLSLALQVSAEADLDVDSFDLEECLQAFDKVTTFKPEIRKGAWLASPS